MFNNFVKSMMALCMVTSGWSTISSESPRGLTQSKIDNFFSNGNKEVDVRTQTIEEEKSQSTTSEAMNKSINTVGTLEIEGHSSGEEGGSGSDSLHYNKDADTSTSSEEVTETQTENNEKRLGQPGCANYGKGDQSGEVVALVDLLDGDQTPNDNSLYTFDEDYQVDECLALVVEFLANIDSSPNGARKNKIVDQLKDLMGRGMIKLDANYSYDLFDALSAYIDVWFDEMPSMSEIICALGKVTNQDTAKDKANVKEIIQSIKRQLCRAYY